MNRAGLGVISRELVDQSVVQGCGFDSGTREARAPIPRTLTLLDIPESTRDVGLVWGFGALLDLQLSQALRKPISIAIRQPTTRQPDIRQSDIRQSDN